MTDPTPTPTPTPTPVPPPPGTRRVVFTKATISPELQARIDERELLYGTSLEGTPIVSWTLNNTVIQDGSRVNSGLPNIVILGQDSAANQAIVDHLSQVINSLGLNEAIWQAFANQSASDYRNVDDPESYVSEYGPRTIYVRLSDSASEDRAGETSGTSVQSVDDPAYTVMAGNATITIFTHTFRAIPAGMDPALINQALADMPGWTYDAARSRLVGPVSSLPLNNKTYTPSGGGNGFVIIGVKKEGFVSQQAKITATAIHEFFHVFLQDGGRDGHLATLVAARNRLAGQSDTKKFEIKPEDVQLDPVEQITFLQLKRAGLIQNEGDYWRTRAGNYTRSLHGDGIETVGDLRGEVTRQESMGSVPGGAMLQRPLNDRQAIEAYLKSPEFALGAAWDVFKNKDGGRIGAALGTVLGRRITDDPFAQIPISATLSTLLGALGEVIDEGVFGGNSTWDVVNGVERSLGDTFLTNLKSAGVGALSSFVVAEIFDALDINGVIGEIGQTYASSYLSAIVSNLPSIIGGSMSIGEAIGNVNPISIAASWVGGKLAAEIKTFDTVGGQIGAAVGAAIGAYEASQLIALAATTGNPYLIVAAVVVVVLDILTFGFIGSIFGGTPRSGADVAWDESSKSFVVANAYSRKGGSKQAAEGLAQVVAGNLDAVMAATGSVLKDPSSVVTGNYGMRKKDYVYRPESSRDKEDITARFTGKDAPNQLVNHGAYIALRSMVGQMQGGSIYAKRALLATLQNAEGASSGYSNGVAGKFSLDTLRGNLAVAFDYANYRANQQIIAPLIAVSPNSGFALGWLATLVNAREMGLDRRAYTDWTGGYSVFLDEATDGVVDGVGASSAHAKANFDLATGNRSWIIFNSEGYYIGDSPDTIEPGSTTKIAATAANETIDLRTGKLTNQIGYTVNGHLNDDIAVTGADFAGKTNAALSIAANARSADASIATVADAVVEPGETFSVSVANGTGVRLIGPEAQVKIVAASDLAYLQVGRSFAAEGDGYAVFRISLSKAATSAVTLALTLAELSAKLGTDTGTQLQISANGTSGWTNATSLTMAAGVTQYFVRVAVTADNGTDAQGKPTNVEGNERFELTATVTAGAAALQNGANPAKGIGTIVDGVASDPLAWADDAIVHEGSVAAISVARSRVVATAASLTYSSADRRILDIPVAATVDAGAGDDIVHASDLGDNVFGGAGNDTLYGGRLDDWLMGGEGSDTLYAGSQAGGLGGDGNFLDGGAGNDTLHGREGSDWLEGGDGVDILYGNGGDDVLTGGAGAGDQLKGGTGNDDYLIRRGDGSDIVEDIDSSTLARDTDFNDVIGQFSASYRASVNAVYDNAIATGSANYLAARAAGLASGTIQRDWIGWFTPGVRQGALDGGEDSITLGAGIGIGDIRLKKSADGKDLIVQVMTTNITTGVETFSGDELTVRNWFTDAFQRVEWLKFADGNKIRIGDITTFIAGTNGSDVLIGTEGNDFIYGGGGDDQLFLLAGNDIGSGGTGHDLVAGDSGNDMIVGGRDADALVGGSGNDMLSGDDGDDDLSAGTGNDILSGGAGNDNLIGGGGDDVFKFHRGDGHDTVSDDFVASGWVTVWQRSGTSNGTYLNGYTLNAAGEIVAPDGTIVRKNVGTATAPQYSWMGRWDYDSDTQTLRRYADPATGTRVADSDTYLGDTIEFEAGIGIQDIVLRRDANDLILLVGDDEADATDPRGTGDSVRIRDWYLTPNSIENLAFYSTGTLALAGYTLTAGTAGNDAALNGGAGQDWITGGGGDDTVTGNAGDDILAGNAGIDTIWGGVGNDVLYGGTGDDTLIGGSGGDILSGGAGSDWASYRDAAAGVTVSLADQSKNMGDAAGDVLASIENLQGSALADSLFGDGGENILEGAKGNDTLQGGAGDDTYVWNAASATDHDGADIIREGGDGTQIVAYADGTMGDGFSRGWISAGSVWRNGEPFFYYKMVVRDSSNAIVYTHGVKSGEEDRWADIYPAFVASYWNAGYIQAADGSVTRPGLDLAVDGGVDTVELGSGINFANLNFEQTGNDLILRYAGATTSQMTLQNQNSVGGRVEFLQFHDGLAANVGNLKKGINGAATDDLVVGTLAADTLSGNDGSDVIYGDAGNDTLYGNAGDDVIEGGAGADILDGGTHSAAADNPTGWGDTVRYAGSSAAVQVDLQKQATGALQTGGDAQGDRLSGFENVTGSAFNDTIYGDNGNNRLFGLDGDDTIFGLGGDDVIVGGAGSDSMDGNDGNDSLSGDEGNDTINGSAGNDLIAGGGGDDYLNGGADKDRITGGDGNDQIDGGTGDDELSGEAGNDTINGGDGNDTIVGGAGNDILNGLAGNDVYAFGRNDGTDTVSDASGVNTLFFGEGITEKDLWITQVGATLRVGVIGGDTVVNFNGYFNGASQLLKIQTETKALFVGHADVRALIATMTAASASATPATMADSVAASAASVWAAGETAAPVAPATPQLVQVNNYQGNSLNVDGWAPDPTRLKGKNLLTDAGWPMDIDAIPAAGTGVVGWENSMADETRWLSTAGPYGQQVVALNTGQTDTTADGGGVHSNQFAVDGSKAYEFTYYFKVDALGQHRIYLGLDMTTVESVETGTATTNPYFTYDFATAGQGYVAGRWYKAVGYVLPQGSANAPLGSFGGIYDTETGTKVGNMMAFRWTGTDPTVRSRMFNYYNEATQGYFTNFYKPEVREVALADMMRAGETLNIAADRFNIVAPLVEGWGNSASYSNDGEARWVQTIGPDGAPITVMEAGQFDATVDGGGVAQTNWVMIDATKTYKLSQWVRKSDLSRHYLYSGLVTKSDAGNVGKQLLATGLEAYSNYSAAFSDDVMRASGLQADEWVRVDAYFLPAGSALTSQALGGVYRADGTKISGLAVPAFRWSSGQTNLRAYARFFTYSDATEWGFSTQFAEPKLTIVADGEPFGTTAGQDALGTLIDASLGVKDFDGDITGYAIDADGLPTKGTLTLVNAATGQFRYTPAEGATGTDRFSVVVSDAAGNKTVVPIDVQLSVPGVNRAPNVPTGGFAATALENSAAGAVAATLTTTDPDNSTGIDYYFAGSLVSLVGGRYVTFSADNRFRLERDYGRVIVNATGLDAESADKSFTYDIRVADMESGLGSRSANSTLTVTVGDVDELHSMTAKSLTVNYFSKALGPLVPMPDADGRALDLRALMLSDPENAAMKFTIGGVSTNGPWQLDQDGVLHLIGAITTGQVYNLTIRATDAANRSVDAVLTLTVNGTDGYTADPAVGGGGGGGGGYYYYKPWNEVSGNYQIPPIVLDLDGDGVELVAFGSSDARFDMDGDGTRDRTGWAGADDGLLAIDINGNGLIDDGSEISFQRFVAGAFSDLDGLAFFDSNGNGRIDAADEKFASFRVWRDANQDGISQAGELRTLSEAGIESISLTATKTGQSPNGSGNTLYALGSYTLTGGATRALGDVFLAFQPTAPTPVVDTTPDPDDAANMPNDADSVATDFAELQFDRKMGKYAISAVGGALAVNLRKAQGLDAQAGMVPAATVMAFRNGSIGMMSPVILDLNGDGVELVSRKKSRAMFDMDGNGSRDRTGWVGKQDGMLVLDRNGNGLVDDGSELNFLSDSPGSRSNLAALRALDSNGDGRLTSADSRFASLKLWVDANGNGMTDAGELKSLADHGIEEIGLSASAASGTAKLGQNLLLATATFKRANGTTGTVGNAALAFAPASPVADLAALANENRLLDRVRQDMGVFGSRSGLDSVRQFGVREIASTDLFAA